MTPSIAITIGCYRLPDFIELNVVQCREVFGEDVPILLSDDRSQESGAIEQIARTHGCSYMCPPHRRSHTSGDLQAFINGAAFATQVGADVAVKLSQRLIPLEGIQSMLLDPFKEQDKWIVVPGQPKLISFARASAKFFNKFTILTDVVAWRPEKVTAQMLRDAYVAQCQNAKQRSDQFIEVFWGGLVQERFKDHSVTVDELANPPLGQPKVYMRKAQTGQHEYHNLAATHGIKGPFEVAEWAHMEQKAYLALAPVV
jgi:hypothetical protein